MEIILGNPLFFQMEGGDVGRCRMMKEMDSEIFRKCGLRNCFHSSVQEIAAVIEEKRKENQDIAIWTFEENVDLSHTADYIRSKSTLFRQFFGPETDCKFLARLVRKTFQIKDKDDHIETQYDMVILRKNHEHSRYDFVLFRVQAKPVSERKVSFFFFRFGRKEVRCNILAGRVPYSVSGR